MQASEFSFSSLKYGHAFGYIYIPLFKTNPVKVKHSRKGYIWFVGMAAKSVNTQTPQEETIEIRPV